MDDAQVWFSKVKEIAAENGFAAEMKDYKANPEAYKGSVSDVAEVLRIATTGRANTPDLYTIMQILGDAETRARIQARTKFLLRIAGIFCKTGCGTRRMTCARIGTTALPRTP